MHTRFIPPAGCLPGLGRLAAVLPLVALALGCGRGYFGLIAADGTPLPAPPYHAFGDSITYGYGLSHPDTQAYPAQIAKARTLDLSNFAIPGDMSCDVPTRQIFPNAEQPTTTQKLLYSLLISTNDVSYRGTGRYEAVFNLCQQASIAWLALPQEYKVAASTASVSGPVHLETATHWNAVTTDAAGASLSFSFTRIVAGPAYLWYRIQDGNPGVFTWSLDGAPPHTLTTATPSALSTANGSHDSLALLRIPALAPGAHTLLLTQTSSAASGMGIVALGLPPVAPFANMPRVLVGTTPPQNRDLVSPCSPNPVPCQVYSADITANATLFAGDGLDVELFNPGKYMSATSADLIDTVHPNLQGHAEIAHAILDIL